VAGRRVVLVGFALWLGVVPGAARETWLKVATPEVTVITTLGAKEATAWASEFTRYIAALRGFLGASHTPLPALTIVVFSQERDFQRYQPLSAPGGKPLPVGGFFARQESWAVVGLPAQVSAQTRRTIFHEGVHWYLSASRTRNPVWLEEGLAEVFSTFHAEKDVAEWGRAIEDHVRKLRGGPLLPLEKLLRTEQGELFGQDHGRTGLVYAQSWAFVHFLIFGRHDIPRNAISAYLEALSNGTPPAAAFRQVFGRTYAEMDRLLPRYLAVGEYNLARLPLAGAEKLTGQPASTVDVEDALGRLAVAGRRTAQAMAHAGAALGAEPEDPRGHELFAVALKASGDAAGALIEFKAAIARGSKAFQPHFEVALAEHQAVLAERRPMTPGEARAIADQYERAIRLYPRHLASFENLAGVIGLAEPLKTEDQANLELGRRLFPESAGIELGLAQLARRGGDVAGARAIVERVLAARQGRSGPSIELAERLKAAWEDEDLARRLDELGRAGRFGEALALLDEKLATGEDGVSRPRLAAMREQLQVAWLSQQVKAALDDRQWVAARRALGRVLASAAPPAMKSEARRTLAELDERRLGLEPEPP